MDLSTTYLGLKLAHPIMPGASPLVDDMDMVRRLEDVGAPAIVMHSLFEEQIEHELLAWDEWVEVHANAHPEAVDYLPSPDDFVLGPEEYLEQIAHIKKVVKIPVIASLNGSTPGGWLSHARLIEQAGADALELNVYSVAAHPLESSETLETRVIQVLKEVRKATRIPIAVKLSPFYTGLAHFAGRLQASGADGLVLFNRFYQPDLDPEELEVKPTLHLSDSGELLLRLRWLAILSSQLGVSLACSGGVHSGTDVIKAVMCGASGVQMVSALLRNGPEHLRLVLRQVEEWLVKHEYHSLHQMQGSMNLGHCPDPQAYERGNYMRILQSWRGYRPAQSPDEETPVE